MNQQKLVEENMNLVYFTIHTFYPKMITDEDIIQCGMVGLCKAAETWDETRSTFVTYACRCIGYEINNEIKSRKRHKGVLSLDYEYRSEDESAPFGEFIVGEQDVGYVDVDDIVNFLSPREKEVFYLISNGVSPSDITEMFGWSRSRTNQIMRKIRLLWRKNYGDN